MYKYKKFIANSGNICVYCFMARYDCFCGEDTANSLGYHYDARLYVWRKGKTFFRTTSDLVDYHNYMESIKI